MIKRLIRSFSKLSLILLLFGCIILGAMIKSGEFPQILMPSHNYDEVLEKGLKKGQHIKGDIYFSLGSFATKESYTQYENSRTPAETSGYYYIIPVGEQGLAAIYIRKDDLTAMKALTKETEAYLMGGEFPKTTIHFNGTAVKMDRNLKGLEEVFRNQLEYMGYTEAQIEDMLSTYSDGECLVLSGPADISVIYVMLAISFVLILAGIILIVRNYRKEAKYDKLEASGLTNLKDE